jgi:hypothetical protein
MAVAEASTIVRWYAYAGCLAVVPVGVAGFFLPAWGTALVIAAALGAWALLLTLIRPDPARVWLPGVWALAAVLAAAGTSSLLLAGAVTPFGFAAAGYGWALAVVTLSYQRRYSAAVRSAASATSVRSSGGASTSASGPRPSSWV